MAAKAQHLPVSPFTLLLTVKASCFSAQGNMGPLLPAPDGKHFNLAFQGPVRPRDKFQSGSSSFPGTGLEACPMLGLG